MKVLGLNTAFNMQQC